VTDQSSPVAGIAGRYATALFELARDTGALDKVAGDLDDLSRLFAASEDLRRFASSLVFDRGEQGRAMAAIAERAGYGDLLRRFLGVMVDNRRLFVLPDAIGAFRTLLARHRDEVTARVVSAVPLSPAQEGELVRALKAALGGSNVKIDARVDGNLLGGLVVSVGSRMFDTSLATKLDRIHMAMREA
jgi:F-type H+-transporting ATPase subunit delta